MKSFFKIKKQIVYTLYFLFFFIHTADANTQVDLYVLGCNNNFVCEAVIGEDIDTCPNDCTPVIPPEPPDPEPDPSNNPRTGSIGTQQATILTVSSIESTPSSISVSLNSNIPVNISASWGSNTEYQIATIQSVGFLRDHFFTINNLTQDTLYTITIVAQNIYGQKVEKTIIYSTQKGLVIVPTIRNLDIEKKTNGLLLTWQNPSEPFDYVRIIRSENFFPTSFENGKIIYEGSAKSFLDTQVKEGVRYYYSIFTKNATGFSTGVSQSSLFETNQKNNFFETGESIDIFGPIKDTGSIFIIQDSFLKDHIKIIQEGRDVTNINEVFYVKNKKDVAIIIDRNLQIPINSQLFFSYFDGDRHQKPVEYVFRYDKELDKFVLYFNVDNLTIRKPFIIYLKKDNQISGYAGYLEPIKESFSDSEQSKLLFLANDFLVSLFSLFSLFFFFFLFLFLVFKRRKKEQ